MIIDGSTDWYCIAIVTNERALLSGSDQPVRNLGRRRILCLSGGKTNSQRTKLTKVLKYIDSTQLESDGAASLKRVVTDSKTSCPRFIIRSIVVMEVVT